MDRLRNFFSADTVKDVSIAGFTSLLGVILSNSFDSYKHILTLDDGSLWMDKIYVQTIIAVVVLFVILGCWYDWKGRVDAAEQEKELYKQRYHAEKRRRKAAEQRADESGCVIV